MGSKVPPDPGDYELGNDCHICTVYPHPIFLPGRNPKYIKVEIFQDYELIDTQILTQNPLSPCAWRRPTVGWELYAWWNYVQDWTQFFRRWFVNDVAHYSFQFFDTPSCLTKIPNQIDPADPDYAGDTAKVTWGEGIEP